MAGEIGCFEVAEYKVDKQSTICIKHNHYSVPDHLLGERVIVKLYSEKVVIFDSKHVKVATHERSYGLNQWRLDITHYINTLMKKTDEFLEIEMGSDDILTYILFLLIDMLFQDGL